ncbi:MAG: hypothetical protein JNK12_03895 [Acidimicrobiales bacterium]|nr:hypothetical protein [Acidimicrobiales bacterium]
MFVAVLLATFLVVAPLPAQARTRPEVAPANDAFASARVITGATGTTSGTNLGATKEANEPDHAGNIGGASVWFTWTAPANGAVSFDTCTDTDFDTLLAVYTGTTVGGLALVAASDDSCTLQGRVSFAATAGTTYRIAIDGYGVDGGAATGNYTLSWAPPPPPPANDAFATPTTITGASGSTSGTNVFATTEPGEPDHAGVVGGASVWYQWAAPTSGPVQFDTCTGTGVDTLLAVYTGTSLAGLTPIATNDDECGSASRVIFPASAGTTYRVAVDGADRGYGTSTGGFTLSWESIVAPANDAFAAAQVISGGHGTATGTNLGAAKETGEPDHAGDVGGASVWYRWTANTTRTIRFDTCTGADFDTLLAVYTGTTVDGLTPIAASDNGCGNSSGVEFTVTAGTTYRIAVDGFHGAVGSTQQGSFTLTWGPPRVHRPDVLIRSGATAWIGNDVYNTTGAGQTRTASVGASGTATFSVKFQNDADFEDLLTARGPGSNNQFRVTYRVPSGEDITAAMVEGIPGTWRSGESSVRVTVTVKARAGTPRGASISLKIKFTADQGTGVDAAIARVTRV